SSQQLTLVLMLMKGNEWSTVPSAVMRQTTPRCSTAYRSPLPSPALARKVRARKPSAKGAVVRWNGRFAVGPALGVGFVVAVGSGVGGGVPVSVGGATGVAVVDT